MTFAKTKKDRLRPLNIRFLWILPILLAALPSTALAQQLPALCAVPPAATYPSPSAAAFPATSDQYSVEYQLDNLGWKPAKVYISKYGETQASPWRHDSGYLTNGGTSMSFVSITAGKSAVVNLRVTKLSGPAIEGRRSRNHA